MRASAQAAASRSDHSVADAAPRIVARLSRRRPTMSRLIIARTSPIFSPPGGVRVKWVEPSVPSSSPENAANTTSRGNGWGWLFICSAISSNAAVPDALSSAPTWGTWLSGAREWCSPKPRWS